MSSLRRIDPSTALFCAAACASGILLIAWQSHLTFFFDDWDPLLYRRGLSADSLLRPHVDHIPLGTTAVYKAIQATFGMESLVPYAVVSTAAFLTSVVLLFVYVRRRVGGWLALAGALPVLFLGAAHADLLWPYQIFFFGSMAGGLGALLCLERPSRRGDAFACALLVLSFTFSELALPFVIGAGAAIALQRGPGRRAFVVAVPLLLYAAWYLGWGHTAESHLSFDNIAHLSSYVMDGLAAGVASLLGLVGTPYGDLGGLAVARPILIALLVAAFLRARYAGPLPPTFWVTAAILLSFWVITGANAGIARQATASRYQYIGAVLILLVAADLAAGVQLGRTGSAVALAIALFATLANLSTLHQSYRTFADLTPKVRGALAGLELEKAAVDPDLVLDQPNSGVNFLGAIRAGPYLSAVDAYGSPAYAEDQLPGAPELARVSADKVMGTALGLGLEPVSRLPAAGCRTLHPARGAPAIVSLTPGTANVLFPPRGGSAELALRRFSSTSFPVRIGELRAPAALSIPPDRVSPPWELRVSGGDPVMLCPISA